MHRTLWILLLTAPVLTGCIAGDAEERHLPELGDKDFQVSSFVQDLEDVAGTSLVTARLDSLQVEVNQSRATLVEWRSFTPQDGGCELLSTMVYEGHGTGGFLAHREDQPCPLAVSSKPSVAEVVALVDRVSLTQLDASITSGAPVYSISLAGYCSYDATSDQDTVHVWNGAGVSQESGQVRCGGGQGSALTLLVTVPQATSGTSSPQSYVILEHVAPQGSD